MYKLIQKSKWKYSYGYESVFMTDGIRNCILLLCKLFSLLNEKIKVELKNILFKLKHFVTDVVLNSYIEPAVLEDNQPTS